MSWRSKPFVLATTLLVAAAVPAGGQGTASACAPYGAQGLQVLGFAVDDPIPALKAYANELGMNYPVLVGLGRNDVLDAFGPMVGLPTTFIIGRDGKICSRHTGFTPKDRFERQIRGLLLNLF